MWKEVLTALRRGFVFVSVLFMAFQAVSWLLSCLMAPIPASLRQWLMESSPDGIWVLLWFAVVWVGALFVTYYAISVPRHDDPSHP